MFRLLVLLPLLLFISGLSIGLRSEDKPSPRVIAVGDLHGDWQAYEVILSNAGLIDAAGNWSGGVTIFVQTGDIVDRGPDSYRIITHLAGLKKQAKRAGGQIITLVGNHEAMNRTGDLRYVHPGEYQAFNSKRSIAIRRRFFKDNRNAINAYYRRQFPELKRGEIFDHWTAQMPLGKLEHQDAWDDKGILGKWVINNPAIVKLADSLFVHGGLSPAYAKLAIAKINKRVRRALLDKDIGKDSILFAPDGPLWYRAYILNKDKTITKADKQAMLNEVLKAQGVDRMVVGHTPSRRGIRARYGGRLIQIDTGASAYYRGTRSFLRLENGRVFAHDGNKVRELAGGRR